MSDLDKLGELSKFIQNPWFGTFCQILRIKEKYAKGATLLNCPTSIETFFTREQGIGELKAYQEFENQVWTMQETLQEVMLAQEVKPTEDNSE